MGIKKEAASKTKKKLRLTKATVKSLDVPNAKDVKGGVTNAGSCTCDIVYRPRSL